MIMKFSQYYNVLVYLRWFLFVFFIFFGKDHLYAQPDITEAVTKNTELADKYLNEGNKTEAAKLYNQNAYLLLNNNQPNQAIEYYQKVLSLNMELNNLNGQIRTHNKLALLYTEIEQYDQAVFHFDQELKLRQSSKTFSSKNEVISAMSNKAAAQSSMNQTEDALKTIEEATSLALETNDLNLIKRCYGITYDIYSNSGNVEKAKEFFALYSAFDKKIKDQKMAAVRNEAAQEVNKAYTEKALAEQELNQTSVKLEETVHSLKEAEQLSREQQMEIDLKEARINEQEAINKNLEMKKRFYAIGFSVLSVFVIILLLMIWQIRRANSKINEQRKRLEKQNKEIKASIRYAKTIQNAILPDFNVLNEEYESFIIYLPKDIVSGDFYWYSEHETKGKKTIYLAVVDCTGHGVPGAFMSMIGSRILTEIVKERNISSPAAILEKLNDLIRLGLRQEQTDNNDGMDLALCQITKQGKDQAEVTFAGAKRPLYIFRNETKKLEMVRGDRKSIGGNQESKKKVSFKDYHLSLGKGDVIYMFSDGLTDQNGPNRKKFGRIRLEEIVEACAEDSMERQSQIFRNQLKKFMGDEEQRDDITLAGLRII